MNKIKDIIYDKSDILIAILILAIAALIIVWRLSIILEYPKQLIGTDDASTVLTEPDEDAAADTATDADAAGTDADAAGSDAAADSQDAAADGDTADQTDDALEVSNTAQWDGDKLAVDLEVKITGTTASEAVQCMVDAGIFADYAEYESICDSMNYDDEKMRAGVFIFAKGTTKEDIIKQVNWS